MMAAGPSEEGGDSCQGGGGWRMEDGISGNSGEDRKRRLETIQNHLRHPREL